MSLVNPLAIGLGTVAGMGVGAIWFARPAFGTAWRRLSGAPADGPASPGAVYGGALVATGVFSAALAVAAGVVAEAFDAPLLPAALLSAVVLWAGVAVTRPAIALLFEGGRKRLFLIHIGHDLAVALVIAAIIGVLGR